MADIRKDALPSEPADEPKGEAVVTQEPVSEDLKTPEDSQPVALERAAAATEPPTIPKGYVPYQALDEERRRRKEAEELLKEKELQSRPAPTNVPYISEWSDEGQAILARQEQDRTALEALRRDMVLTTIPADQHEQFETLEREYPELSVDKVRDLFVKLRAQPESPPRKGLERPSGGDKTPPPPGPSAEDSERLRLTDPKAWGKAVLSGKIETKS